jgi:large subunit ribosomal protein L10
MAKAKSAPKTRKKLGGAKTEGGYRADKVQAVADMKARLNESSAIILTEYRGMSVNDLAALRTSLAKGGTDYKVVKNTLATIAARDAGMEDLLELLEGPTAWAFVTGDVVGAAKEIADFAKRQPALVVKGAVLEGRLLPAEAARKLATLESREVLLAKTAGLFITPIQQAANLFAAPFNKLGAALVALKDKLAALQAA